MKSTTGSVSRLLVSVAILCLILASGCLADGQEPKGVPWDWTHHRVVFSQPGTAEEAIQKGEYEHWLKISTSQRYLVQQEKRRANAEVRAHEEHPWDNSADESPAPGSRDERDDADDTSLERRWSPGAGNRPLPLGLVKAIVPPLQRTGGNSAIRFAHEGFNWAEKTPNRIKKDWSELLGSGGTVGMGQFPATYTTGSTSCSDFVVFNTGLTGSGAQASIIAFNNIYASCNGGVPTVYWAYNTGGTAVTSVTLSLDGLQVAFVQSSSGSVASLVLLKWKAANGTLTSPVSPTSEIATAYDGCAAPCMTTMTFSGSPNDTHSAPFTAYGSSAIYVGDDVGVLHQFTNIFAKSGTPAEVTTGGWPATVNANAALDSPVYDAGSGKTFVGDYILNSSSPCEPSSTNTDSPCGYLYAVNSSGGVTRSMQLDYNNGFLDGPIVDSTTEEVFVFAGDDGSSNCASSTPCAAVFQFPASFIAAASGKEATVGAGYEFMLSGTLDNAYFTSPTHTGHLYVVGNTGPANNTLYQVSINNAVMATGAATVGPQVSTNYTNGYYSAGLELTEFYPGGSNDYIFLSVLAYGAVSGCGTASLGNGCVIGYNVFSGTISGSTAPTGATAEAGGTSGIVIDNAASGAQNVYFSTLLSQTCTTSGGTGGCAIQTVQSAP